jgi:hypothetical protein
MGATGDNDFFARFKREQPVEIFASAEPKTASNPKSTPPIVVGSSTLANKLGAVSERAIDTIDEILAIPLNPESDQYASVLRAKTAAANTALTTMGKVDENRLRGQAIDRLPELFKIIAEEEQAIAERRAKAALGRALRGRAEE